MRLDLISRQQTAGDSPVDVLPVTLATAKAHLHIGSGVTKHDTELAIYVDAARDWAEKTTGRALISQVWNMWLDSSEVLASDVLTVPIATLQATGVTITSYDADDAATVKTASTYGVSTPTDSRGRIYLNDGQSWPSDLRARDALKIVWTAGYGDAATDVPDAIISAMLMRIGTMFLQREDTIVGQSTSTITAAEQMLTSYRIITV